MMPVTCLRLEGFDKTEGFKPERIIDLLSSIIDPRMVLVLVSA
jgi:hypothetical protein